MTRKTGILVHMDDALIAVLDEMSDLLGMPRAELIRRCLRRDIKFVKDYEVRELKAAQHVAANKYQEYMSATKPVAGPLVALGRK